MEQSKIKNIITDYLTDHSVYHLESKAFDQLFTEVINILHHVREHDADFLYNNFNNSHLFQQQKVICMLLDNICINEEIKLVDFIPDIIKQHPSVAVVSLIITGLLSKYRAPITRGTMSFLSKLGKVIEQVGKFITHQGRYSQFRYAIIQQNSEKCYKACGITDVHNIKPMQYFNYHVDKSENLAVGKCLAQCYIQQQIEISMMLLRLYLICLKNTNKFNNIGTLDDAQIYTLFFHPETSTKKYVLSGSCEEYFTLISKTFNVFNDLLSYVYSEERFRRETMNQLYNQIKQVKNEVSRTDIKILKKKYK